MPDFTGIRDWSPSRLATEVAGWAGGGEGQAIEFKEELPAQARDLAKEIAAFATSNDGVILLGVSDAGEILGISDLSSSDGRTAFTSRLEGVAANSVKPLVHLHVDFAEVEGVWCAAVFVEKGAQPVYYATNVPYLRQLTSARPANPEDVVDLVFRWHEARSGARSTPEAGFRQQLTQLIVEVLVETAVLADEEHQANPWREGGQILLREASDIARNYSARIPAGFAGLDEQLEIFATAAEAAGTQRFTMQSGWTEFAESVLRTHETAETIRRRWLEDRYPADHAAGLEAEAVAIARQTSSLRMRAAEFANRPGGLEDLKVKAGQFGRAVLRLAQYGDGFVNETGRELLAGAAHYFLHVETLQLFADGGTSVRRIVDGVRTAHEHLASALRKLGLVEHDFL